MSDFRIISLFPSSSDILFDLNLQKQLVAVSHECLEKNKYIHLPRITSTCININVSQSEIDFQVRDKVKKNEPISGQSCNILVNLLGTGSREIFQSISLRAYDKRQTKRISYEEKMEMKRER